jgi:succinoglycan biosynthesis transport protein ExoP
MNERMPENEVVNVNPAIHAHANTPDFTAVLLRRKAYLVFGAIIGLIIGFLYYIITPKSYESSGRILVLKKQTENPLESSMRLEHGGVASSGTTEDFLETHKAVLRSPLIIERAIEKANLQELDSFRGHDRIVDAIIKSMKVERDLDKKAAARFNSSVLNVSFRGPVPEESSVVVNAILDSYQDFLNDTSRGSIAETMKLIRQAHKLIKNEMEQKEREWEDFRMKTPVLWKTATGATLYMERLEMIDLERAGLMRQQAEVEAVLSAIDNALKKGDTAAAMRILAGLPGSREVPTSMMPVPTGSSGNVISAGGMSGMGGAGGAGGAGGGGGMRMGSMGGAGASSSAVVNTLGGTLETEVLKLRLEEGKLLGSMGPRHPDIIEIRERIETLQNLMTPGGPDPSHPTKLSEKDARLVKGIVDTKLGQLRQQLEEIKRSQDALAGLFQRELDEAKKVFPYESRDETFKRQIERSYFLYENIAKHMSDLDIVSSVGGYDAQVIAPPQPGEKVAPRGILVFPVALFLGLLAGFGLGYLAEITDKSFHTPEEIRARLGLPLIGHIPVIKQDESLLQKIEAEGGRLSPALCTHYRPKSRDAEAYRGVRTALYFSTRGGNYKTIQVTSPDMGDGKSTLAANLAVSIAQSGKKVILIDADFRRPQQNEIFGLPNKVGFATVLAGSAEIPEAIRETPVPGLTVMTSGAHPPNPAELLTSHRFKEMLNVLSEQYDLVLVDTPPLLAVSDPSVIAPRVDGVILTLRISKKNRPHAEQAREILTTLGANVLGVVVNAIKGTGASRYGYGGYGYGYGYGNYGTDENAKYYQDETHETSNGKV